MPLSRPTWPSTPVYQRIVAHQPVLDDAARVQVGLLAAPAVALMDTSLLPAAFKETWRQGEVSDTGLIWAEPPMHEMVELPARPADARRPRRSSWWQGRGCGDETGFAAAKELADALGGVVAGDVTALDAGWITEEEVVGLTGTTIAPKLCIALGVDGDTELHDGRRRGRMRGGGAGRRELRRSCHLRIITW